MPLIVGGFKAADRRRGGTHYSGELSLRQDGVCAKSPDTARHLLVCTRLFQRFQPARLAFVKPAVQEY
jgi:hypothetical protein